MRKEIGARVFAVQSADDDCVRLFGYGIYKGDHACPLIMDIPNPMIELDDDAGIVWGCECWWGPESKAAEFIGNRTVEVVAIPDRSPQTTAATNEGGIK